MRVKFNLQPELCYCSYSSIKIVEDYVNKYKCIDEIVQQNPQIFDRVHQDFEKNCLVQAMVEQVTIRQNKSFVR